MAIGGRYGSTFPLATAEYLTADDAGNVSAWTALSASLSVARADLALWVVRSADASIVPQGEYWLYAGPGRNSTSFVSSVDALKINSSGFASAFFVANIQNGAAGYGAFVENARLLAVAGSFGPSSAVRAASLSGSYPALGS